MSQDPGINAAILNYMAKVGNASSSNNSNASDQAPAATAAVPTRPAEEYEWLRQAMAAVESPERKLKKMLAFVAAYCAEVFEGGPAVTGPVIPSGRSASTLAGQQTAPTGAPAVPSSGVREGSGEGEAEEKTFANADEKNDFLLETLEEVSDMVEDINWAAEFGLMNGPAVILRFLAKICDFVQGELHRCRSGVADNTTTAAAHDKESATEAFKPVLVEVEAMLCMIVAHAGQLNDALQSAFHTCKWNEPVLHALRLEREKGAEALRRTREEAGRAPDSAPPASSLAKQSVPAYAEPSAQVVASALHACSSLCRHSQANTLAFIESGGMELLISLLRFASDAAGRERPSYLTNKVLARIFFFAAYLADNGLSAEELIELICQHSELPSSSPSATTAATTTSYETTYDESGDEKDMQGGGSHAQGLDEPTERAAATALLELMLKSPKVVKARVRSLMPERLQQWAIEVNDTEDPRRRLVDELAKAS